MRRLLRDTHPFGGDQAKSATGFGQQLVNMKAAVVFVDAVCAERSRRRRTQDNISANADPIPVAMTVKHHDTPCMRRQKRYEIRSIDQGQTDALTPADRNRRAFDNLVMQKNEPGVARVLQDQAKRLQLRWADCVRQPEMASRI